MRETWRLYALSFLKLLRVASRSLRWKLGSPFYRDCGIGANGIFPKPRTI